MPNVIDHEDWMKQNIPLHLLKEIANEGHTIVLVCVSSTRMIFKTMDGMGISTEKLHQGMQYFEYGIEKELEEMNSCLNNCTESKYLAEIVNNRQKTTHYTLTSPECSVNVTLRKANVAKSWIAENNYDKTESFSMLCKDVIADGSVCNSNRGVNEKEVNAPVVTTNIEDHNLDNDQWRFQQSINNYHQPETYSTVLGNSAVSSIMDSKKDFTNRNSWHKHMFTPMNTKQSSSNHLSNHDNSMESGKDLTYFSRKVNGKDSSNNHINMATQETNGARRNNIFDWMKGLTGG